MTIYKKFLITTLLFLLLNIYFPSIASQIGRNDYNCKALNYTSLNPKKIREEAQKDFYLYFKTSDIMQKEKYINSAMNKYYILTTSPYFKSSPPRFCISYTPCPP